MGIEETTVEMTYFLNKYKGRALKVQFLLQGLDPFMTITLFSNQLFSLAGAFWHSLIDFGRATLIYSSLGSGTEFPKYLLSRLHCTICLGQKQFIEEQQTALYA